MLFSLLVYLNEFLTKAKLEIQASEKLAVMSAVTFLWRSFRIIQRSIREHRGSWATFSRWNSLLFIYKCHKHCLFPVSTAKDCEMATWEEWSGCNARCGRGYSARRRRIISYPEEGGKPCGTRRQTRGCYHNDYRCRNYGELILVVGLMRGNR